MTNSQYLKWFYQIEKALWSLFDQFEDLCGRCAVKTLQDVERGQRKGRDAWCCCMIDNQVHDNWEALNTNQIRSDRDWYDKLPRQDMGRRMPGNGPCPALNETGCQIRRHRPITCTTQLCTKMLVVLNTLNLVKCPVHHALQIEDIIALPDILPSLYGTARKPKKVTRDDVNRYVATIRSLRDRFAALPLIERKNALERALPKR
jgi:Fe-S-cluster containining protein